MTDGRRMRPDSTGAYVRSLFAPALISHRSFNSDKREELRRRDSDVSVVCKIDPFLYFASTLLLVRFSKIF
jgi:hypothetical protein